MTRKEFIKHSLSMGLGLPFLSSILLESCSKDPIFPDFTTDFSGKVTIVGAGAAGMAAGYLLKRYGIDFQIIEAAPVYGGRLKKAEGFADHPIDLGAEWIHTKPSILADIINDPEIDAKVDIIVYNPQTIKAWNNGKLRAHNYVSSFYTEWKFKHTTWFDFFEEYIVPHIIDNIVLQKPITGIDYNNDKVLLRTADNETFESDKVLITSSIKTLQEQQITFSPALPQDKLEAIDDVFMGDGIKIFVEFKEQFYPEVLVFGKVLQALEEEEKFVYDAMFRKNSNKNVLGLFAINEKARAYTKLSSETEIIEQFLSELDEIFDGKASENYIDHIIQNWSNEPYIKGSYSYSFKGDQESVVKKISEPVMDRLFFAGEALSIEDTSTVHGACASAYATIKKMVSSPA